MKSEKLNLRGMKTHLSFEDGRWIARVLNKEGEIIETISKGSMYCYRGSTIMSELISTCYGGGDASIFSSIATVENIITFKDNKFMMCGKRLRSGVAKIIAIDFDKNYAYAVITSQN